MINMSGERGSFHPQKKIMAGKKWENRFAFRQIQENNSERNGCSEFDAVRWSGIYHLYLYFGTEKQNKTIKRIRIL